MCGLTWRNQTEPPQEKYQINQHSFKALIDTGAQRTCINKKVIDTLDLELKTKGRMQSASAIEEVNLYRIDISIPITQRKLVGVKDGKVIYENRITVNQWESKTVMELKSYDRFDVLLGMDILSECNLIIAHGEFVLAI